MIDNKMLIEKLKEAGAYLGYSKSKRHPSVRASLYTTKNNKDIINLEETAKQIEVAAKFLAGLAADKKQVLFVGVKPEARAHTRNAAMLVSQPYATERFIGGTLTNFSEVKKRLDKLVDLMSKREKGELSMYTKKEQSLIDKDIARMNINFGGLLGINGNPAAMVLVDAKFENIALTEAQYTRTPVVALVNTDCDIKGIKYPIVVNESSAAAVGVVLETLAKEMQSAMLEVVK
jgi:small subunit ribosomal protein S2